MFSFKLKQKFLSVIVLVVLIVMIVSSLVVSYVIYQQNVETTNAGFRIGINTIKKEITDIEQELIRKTGQMNTLFKVNENLKFLADFKHDYDLSMTEPTYVDVTASLFSAASSENIEKMAIYDTKGELVAFSEQQKDGSRLMGYYYVNPEKAFRFTRIHDNEDLKKSQWQTAPGVDDLSYPLHQEPMTDFSPVATLGREDNRLALFVKIPILMDDYSKETDKMEPRIFGHVQLVKTLGQSFVTQISALTGLQVNLFAKETLSLGTLPGYTRIQVPEKKNEGLWQLEKQELVLGTVVVEKEKYRQGLLPVYADQSFAGAVALLQSDNTVMDNTLQVVYILIIVYLCCLVLIIPIALFFSSALVKSLLKVSRSLADVARGEGDLTRRIDISSKDEIGDLSHWFNMFVENLQAMIKNISKSAGSLNTSVDVTRKSAGKIAANASDMADVTQGVTAATGEMSSEISAISRVIGHASDNLDIVAASTEEMTATITEIAKNAENARTMSTKTGQNLETASRKVAQLGEDAKQIDAFTEAITEISAQTNLLALNATIEAARAGEAGKGFAVVAGEIKALAQQTAAATQDIKDKIRNIQTSSSESVSRMTQIFATFTDMQDVVNDIASAIEEQTATTQEIADNTATVASGISDVNTSISQFDALTTDIAKDMEKVSQASTEMSENCTHIAADTQNMETETRKLDDLIHKFKVE
ncbi:MAG TPA: methyl-accepting chemotaxis protein [Desulfotignum sp.]|nr:methyl-accepting chemotaxis protein [Desulfotignum sp.]